MSATHAYMNKGATALYRRLFTATLFALASLGAVVALFSTSAIVSAQIALTVSKDQPELYTRAFVQQALDYYDANGRQATIDYYNAAASVDGEWYVFIWDSNGVALAHPTVPETVGTSRVHVTDINGYRYGPDILSAPMEGNWVSYVFQNPADGGALQQKHTWSVRHDGLIFSSGWYEDEDHSERERTDEAASLVRDALELFDYGRQRGLALAALIISLLALDDANAESQVSTDEPDLYTKYFVQQALDYYDENGRQATIRYYNSTASVDGEWYVFIVDENDLVVAHPTIPDTIGEDLKGDVGTDINGYNFGSVMASATEQGRWISYTYLNPARGNVQEQKHSWVIRRDGLLFGSGWYEEVEPTKRQPAAYTRSFVQEAIDRYDADGRQATIDYYNSVASIDGEWYVFISDESDLVVAHATIPELLGLGPDEITGPDGYPTGRAIADAADEDGEWVDYTYLNPATGKLETKHSWVIRYDGLVFGSGWYETLIPTKQQPDAYTRNFVQEAIDRYDADGRQATIDYYNSDTSVDGEWYVFIVDENDLVVAHPTVPDNIGQDLTGPLGTDINGYDFGSEMVSATEEGKWVSYTYLNPARDDAQEQKHTWVIRRDGLLFGSGWYER